MSRSAARSHDEKHKGPKGLLSVQVSTPTAQKLEAEDAILGRLTQAQLTDLLIREDAEETVGEIMDELLTKVMEGCYMVYINRQLIPFCTSWAKNYLIQILPPQLLCADKGEGPEEASKTEDPEPLPLISDVWAQGCVPVVPSTPLSQPTLQQEADICRLPAQIDAGSEQRHMAVDPTYSSPKQSEKETSPRRPVSNKDYKGLCLRTPQTERKKKQQFILIPKPVPGKLLPSRSCSIERKDVALDSKTIAHSVQLPKTGQFSPPRRQPIPKIDFSSLRRQTVVPLYEIVDYDYTKPMTPSGLSKLKSKHNMQQTEWKGTSLKPLASFKDQPTQFQRRNEADVLLKKSSPSNHKKERIVSSASLRLDTMVLAKGVSISDPKAAEMNPLKYNPPRQGTKLRPIQSVASVPLFSVDKITSGPPPRVIPLYQPKK